jgi:FkbM family methyltransferase
MPSRFRSLVRRVLRPNLHKPDVRKIYKIYGTEYGGWPLIDGQVDAESIVYSFGVGEDISFDLGAIAALGCEVWAFDPTPKSVRWIAGQKLPEKFHFQPVGIAARDGKAEFFSPVNPDFVSYSSQPVATSPTTSVECDVRRLASIMDDLGHSKIDVLKMDIEGFEYDVLDDILSTGIRPAQLLLEFHHRLYGIPTKRTCEHVEKLRAAGYSIFYISNTGREYGLVRA